MINFVKDFYKGILEYIEDENVSYEKKNFYLAMFCSVPTVLLVCLAFIIDGTNPIMILYCACIVLFFILCIGAAAITEKCIGFSHLFCFFLNFFIIPSMFFMSEGIYFGMTLFFILGIILTVVLLGRQKWSAVLVTIEFLYDLFLIVYAYYFKNKVYVGQSNMSQEDGIALSFGLVGVTVIFLFIYQNYVHKEMRIKIEKDNEFITKAENTKGRFLANMTHEIRTPMNAIIGMNDLILKEDLSKNAREHSDTIKAASTQLLQIINNILEFSKLDSGRAELINNEYSFKALIEEINNNISSIYVKDDISLEVFIKKDIPDRLFGDEIRIKQVLRYLLLSPLSRSSNGSVNLEVDYDYDEDNRVIVFKFRIASTGSGLTAEEIEAIYNAYSSYDSRQKTDYNRTGLEFSICQKIVKMMDGDIKIESIEGIGNAVEFTFSNYVVDDKPIIEFNEMDEVFPLVYAAEKRDAYAAKKLLEEVGIAATYVRSPIGFRSALEKRKYTAIYVPESAYEHVKEYIKSFECEDKVFVIGSISSCIGDFDKCKVIRRPVYLFNFIETINGKYDESKYKNSVEVEEIKYPYARVLCVDDSTVNLKVLENILREYGISPKTCLSGKEALELLETDEFDIMFIDQKMPEMDGIELVNRIKLLPNANSSAPTICATADFGNNIKEELKLQGFSDYLAKPINRIYLEKTLKEYLPLELRVINKGEKKEKVNTKAEAKKEKEQVDPLEFNPDLGIANLGGNKEAYISVLLAYYIEGVQKLIEVPVQYTSGDLQLYTTNVHALKSSSATVGCMGVSPLFKALEFAGKENNIDFIAKNNDQTFEYFSEVLNKVKAYLENENAFEEEGDSVDDREVVVLDKELLQELSTCILTMNLRRSEEIIDLLLSNNYGNDINVKIKEIKKSYDNFEYMEIKKYIEELL